jgi:hypothetical protein
VPELTTGDLTLGTGSSIGRYFGLVSAVPSVLFAAWVYLLFATGALGGEPSVSGAAQNVMAAPLRTAAVLGLLALGVGLVVHPLQFALVQLFEGYWGDSAAAKSLRAYRTAVHLERLRRATLGREDWARHERTWRREGFDVAEALLQEDRQDSPEAKRLLRIVVEANSAEELAERYPGNALYVMPTSLGNALRKYEMRSGRSINLPILTFASHIGLVADPAHTAYVQDQRNGLDLAVRMSAMSAVATALTVAAMWPHGVWLTLALVPYCAAWMSYRGAVTAAHTYGLAFSAWLDLNRFKLYEGLHLPIPGTSELERTQNSELNHLIQGSSYTAMYDAKSVEGTRRPPIGRASRKARIRNSS